MDFQSLLEKLDSKTVIISFTIGLIISKIYTDTNIIVKYPDLDKTYKDLNGQCYKYREYMTEDEKRKRMLI